MPNPPVEQPTGRPGCWFPSYRIVELRNARMGDLHVSGYRVPGEFTHRLTGDQYGFESLSFIITETHPGGGPGLHMHDTEEAHVLLTRLYTLVNHPLLFLAMAPARRQIFIKGDGT